MTNFWSATMVTDCTFIFSRCQNDQPASSPQEVSGVGPRAKAIQVSSEGDGKTGSFILEISDRLVSTMLHSSANNGSKKSLQTTTVGKRSSRVFTRADCPDECRFHVSDFFFFLSFEI